MLPCRRCWCPLILLLLVFSKCAAFFGCCKNTIAKPRTDVYESETVVVYADAILRNELPPEVARITVHESHGEAEMGSLWK